MEDNPPVNLQDPGGGYLSFRASITKSSLTGAAQFLANTVLVFATIPIFVRILGAEAYGVFSLVAIIGNVNTFANVGLSPSLVRFLASQGKSQESDHDIVVTFLLLFMILTPLALAGMLLQNEILTRVFNVPNVHFDTGRPAEDLSDKHVSDDL
jgi:O-antigen/teichoic acid export membrane protein